MHAFSQRLRAEFDPICRALRRQGIDRADAEDLAQEVLLVAWRRWADFDATYPLRPWLMGIAFNVAHRHRRRRRPPLVAGALPWQDEAPPPERHFEAAEARDLVTRALARLPERHRTLLSLHDLDELSVEEITLRSGIRRFTIYTRLRRARLALAREIARVEVLDATEAQERRTSRRTGWLLLGGREALPAGSDRRGPASGSRQLPRLPAAAPVRSWFDSFDATARRWLAATTATAALATLAVLAVRATPSSSTSHAQPAVPKAAPAAGLAASRLPSHLAARSLPNLLVPRASWNEFGDGAARARDGLVGHWAFDDLVGSASARDGSGNDHHCRLRGIDPQVKSAWVPGLRGRAIDLGFRGWLECPLPHGNQGGITVAAWVKRGGNPIYHHAIATRAMAAGRSNQFFFGFAGDKLTVSSAAWHGAVEAAVPDAPGRWMHVAFTHDGQHVVKLFRDGVVVGEKSSRVGKVPVTEGPLLVGGGWRNGDRTRVAQHFEGIIDDLSLYDRALGDDELRALAMMPAD
jgi:RNA polymerase sigma-70 factor (ECF subfamily)